MELRWDRLNWQDFEDLRENGYNRVILPLGTIEAHGVIPLGTDNIIPENIAQRIAPDIKAIIAPTISYGVTRSLLHYPGSLSKGMEKIVIINGHGGHLDELKQIAFEIHEKTQVKVAVIHWWILCQDLGPEIYGTEGGHAAVDETAAIIACAPETVKKEKYSPDMLYRFRQGVNVYPSPSTIIIYKEDTGALDFDAKKADDYFKAVCQRIKNFILDVFKSWDK
jgi:creatinine amidohydrolase